MTKHCPSSHKWAYLDGRYCCMYAREKVDVNDGTRCDGSRIKLNSSCCKDNAYLRCPHDTGCVNAGNTNTLLGKNAADKITGN